MILFPKNKNLMRLGNGAELQEDCDQRPPQLKITFCNFKQGVLPH